MYHALQQASNGDQYRIGARRAARGENALLGNVLAAHGVHLAHLALLGGEQVRPVQHHDVRIALDAVEQFVPMRVNHDFGLEFIVARVGVRLLRQTLVLAIPEKMWFSHTAAHSADGGQGHG